MSNVLVPLAKGVEELEAVAMIDTMRRGGIAVMTVSLDENRLVEGANGITLQADNTLDNIDSSAFDMLALPGGWGGTYALAEDNRIIALAQKFKESKVVGAMCAAPFVLKKAGVLGESYTCYPGAVEEINYPGYTHATKVVVDGNVMTSQGPGTAACFGLAIVERFMGKEPMQAVKDGMLLGYC
jgi:4-methyl-5(b-hydroxyethyl)-thiazole monophosphate biosynthesis